MRLLLMAHNVVGTRITNFLLNNYKKDLSLVVTTGENYIFRECNRMSVPVRTSTEKWYPIPPVDLGILAWWPHIIKKELIEFPKHGFINTHPSYLPYNRGKHYNFWALAEQTPFGVTLHRVDEGIDTGPIIAQRKIPYGWTDTGETLYYKAQDAMVDLFMETYPKLRRLKFKERKQAADKGSFHKAEDIALASQIHLDATYKARDLLNLLRARTFDLKPNCWFMDKGVEYEVSTTIRRVS
jgi:methionyl-tRNA formyltransferase